MNIVTTWYAELFWQWDEMTGQKVPHSILHNLGEERFRWRWMAHVSACLFNFAPPGIVCLEGGAVFQTVSEK
jgi:hypothetical protein